MPYSLVQQVDQASQLAAYDICDSREAGPGTIPLKTAWLNYRVGDCLTFQPEDGWSMKVLVIGRALDAQTGAVTFTVRSETDGKHSFALGLSGTAPPTASLSYSDAIPAPAGDWSASGTTATAGGVTQPALVVTGACSIDAADAVVFDYRLYTTGLADGDNWIGTTFDGPDITRKEFAPLLASTAYQVGVRYRVRGRLGPRAIFGPVTTGAPATDFAVVSGTTKPADNATYGAPTGTPVGSITAADVSSTINSGGGVATNQVATAAIVINGITNPGTSYTDGRTSADIGGSGGWLNIQTCTLTTTGAPVDVTVGCRMEQTVSGETSLGTVRVQRDGTTVFDGADFTVSNNGFVSFEFTDSPSAGSHTWTVDAYKLGGSGSDVLFASKRLLKLKEYKR